MASWWALTILEREAFMQVARERVEAQNRAMRRRR